MLNSEIGTGAININLIVIQALERLRGSERGKDIDPFVLGL